jgi:hypothetical protein
MLETVVRANVGRFFVKNGVPLLTTGVEVIERGEGWSAAVERPVIDAIVDACAARGLRVAAIVPAVLAIPQVLHDPVIAWLDGDVAVEVSYTAERRLSAIRRLTIGDAGAATHPQCGGEEDAAFADALGATMIARKEPLAIRGDETRKRQDRASPVRLILAAAALCVSVIAYLVGPAWLQQREARTAATRFAAVASDVRGAEWTVRELAGATAKLAAVSRFAAQRRSATLLLADLTLALPEDVFLTNLRVDESGGSIVALAPRAAMVPSLLEPVRSISSPSIVGAVTMETVAGERMERVTVRFSWRVSHAQSRTQRTR